MNAMSSDVFPFRLHWDAQDLADAVPLRLFELCDFSAGGDDAACANAGPVPRVRRTRGYLPAPAFAALFRVGE